MGKFKDYLDESLNEGKPIIITPKQLSKDGDKLKFANSSGVEDVEIVMVGKWLTVYKYGILKNQSGTIKALNKYLSDSGLLYYHKLINK